MDKAIKTNHTPRLNPFAFPAATDFRFWLLILSVLGASLFTFEWLYFSAPGTAERYLETARGCLGNFSDLVEAPSLQALAGMDGTGKCMAQANQEVAVWGLLGLGLVILIAILQYWTFPGRKIRKDQLEPLSAQDAPEVVEALRELSREAGLDKAPTFLWKPLNPAPGGVAFGRLREYYVSLSGGLVTQFYTDPAAFRAVALHELAHIRNQDIDKTYLTVSIWRAYVLAALLPLAVSFLFSTVEDILGVGWRAAVLAGLVYLTRNAVLRTREIYADVRASGWGERRDGLERMIGGLKGVGKGGLRSLLQVHPEPEQRQEAIRDTSVLFKISIWDSLATGIAASISFSSLEALVYAFAPTATVLPSLIAASLLASMAAGVVGLEIWRAVFASLALRRKLPSLLPAGLGLGVGIAIGRELSFMRYIETYWGGLNLADQAARFGFTVVWLGVLLLGLLLWAAWVAGGASEWLKVAAVRRGPRGISAAGLAVAGFLLVIWTGSLLWLAKFAVNLGTILVITLLAALAIPSVVAYNPLTLLAAVSLWAFPLGAWLWRQQSGGVSRASWAYLDTQEPSQGNAERVKLNPPRALGVGLSAGIVFCIIYLLARVGLRLGVSEAVRDTEQFKLLLYYGSVAAAVLLQGLAAGVTALWARRLGLSHGLLAAFGAGSICAFGMLAINLLFGGSMEPAFAWQTYSLTVNLGALLSIPIAGLAAWAGSWLLHREGDAKRPVLMKG